MVGNWVAHEMDKEAQAVFDAGVATLVGVGYKPLGYATQVVQGVNYKFICIGTIAPKGNPFFAFVTIYKDLDGSITVKNISRVDSF